MKRRWIESIHRVAMILLTVLGCLFGMRLSSISVRAAEMPKDIYIVYDTSGSMLEKSRYSSYPWYEAGYATEVFCSLLEEEDRLYIYFMSDDGDYYFKKEYSGTDDAVHELHTDLSRLKYTANTYMNGLKTAIQEMQKADGSGERKREKYLVILSDGDFNKDGRMSLGARALKEELKHASGLNIPVGYLKLSDNVNVDGESITVFNINRGETARQQTKGRILDVFSDMGNWIFERQKLLYQVTADDGNRQTITLKTELPVRRLMLVGQVTNRDVIEEAIVFDSPEFVTGMDAQSRRAIEGLSKDNVQYDGPNSRAVMENLQQGDYCGVVCSWDGADMGLAAPGTYTIQIPSGMTADIFVEYEIEYRIGLEETVNGKLEYYPIQDNEFCLSGNYNLKVELVNSQSQKPIPGTAGIYKLLDVKLTVQNNGADTVVNGREQTVSLEEGELKVTGNLTLGKNIPKSVDFSKKVVHRLGEIKLDTHGIKFDFDIDSLKDRERAIKLDVQENGLDISKEVEVSAKGTQVYQYECRQQDGQWMILPVLGRNQRPFVGKDSLTIHVKGEKDKQPIEASRAVTVDFRVEPKNILFETERSKRFFLNGAIMVYPNILGKTLVQEEDLGKIDVDVDSSDYEVVQSVKGQFTYEEKGEERVLELEKKEGGFLVFHMNLKRSEVIRLFWMGGTVEGRLQGSCVRQGVNCVGEQPVSLYIQPGPSWIRWSICIAACAICWGFLVMVIKMILHCRFCFIPVKAERIKRFVPDENSNPVDLDIKNCRVRNYFVLHNSIKKIKIEDVPGGQIILVRQRGGKFRIVNAKELKAVVYFETEGDLDKAFRWYGELRLQIKGEYPMEIRFRKRGTT